MVMAVNLIMVYTCKVLGSTNENSRDPDSFEYWQLANNVKKYGGWILAATIKLRRIF